MGSMELAVGQRVGTFQIQHMGFPSVNNGSLGSGLESSGELLLSEKRKGSSTRTIRLLYTHFRFLAF
jgi:transketolase N-terminal domain/subunit